MSTAIVNNFSHPVILDDNRDPNVSWQNHIARGSSGGVDLAYPYGTPVSAPAAGRLTSDGDPDGSGGRMAVLYIDHPEISRIEFLHMSSVFNDESIAIGDNIGKSGASGFGKDWGYAAHLHVHAYDKAGRRVNLWNYFSAAPSVPSAPAGGGSSADYLFVNPDQATQRDIQNSLKARGRYSGPADGIFGGESYKGIQRTIVNVGYTGPIDGDIRGEGCRLIQVYAQKFGGYTGPIDRKLGPNSWAGFARGLRP